MKFRRGELLVVISAAGFGIMPVLAKFAYKTGASVSQVLSYRFIIASVFMWCYTLFTRKDYKIDKKTILYLSAISIFGYDTTAVASYTSYKYISAGLADLLLFLYPPIVIVVQKFFMKERASTLSIFALILSLTGIAFIVWTPNINYDYRGIIAGLLSAFFYCFYVLSLGNRKLHSIDSIVIITYVLTFCALGMLLYDIFNPQNLQIPSAGNFLLIFLISIFSTIMPVLFFYMGVKIIGASKASIISTLEPFVATASGALLFGDRINFFTILGGLLIISSVIFIQIDSIKTYQI